jgi:hypothetical protein
VSNETPTLRQRVWNLLGTARTLGRAGVTVAVLAATLGATPEGVLGAMLPEMTQTPEGETAPAVYCQPGDGGPTLVPRRFPGTGTGGA